MEEIPLFTTTTRIIEVKNQSTKLPIICQFKTRAYVYVEPHKKTLNPEQSFQFSVHITPKKCGPVDIKLKFDLLYKTMNSIKDQKVGKIIVPLKYFSRCSDSNHIDCKVNKCQLLSTVNIKDDCKDLFFHKAVVHERGFQPLIDFKLTCKEMLFKQCHKELYNKFLRGCYDARKKLEINQIFNSDYILTDQNQPLAEDKVTYMNTTCQIEKHRPARHDFFIPLTSIEILRIKVRPRSIDLRNVAKNSTTKSFVSISNDNNFAVNAWLWSDIDEILVPENDHYKLGPKETVDMYFDFLAIKSKDRFDKPLHVIINEQVAVEITVCGNAVEQHLVLESQEIEFKENENSIKYLDMYNPFTIPVSFEWMKEISCYDCYPMSATVPPGKHMICTVEYHSERLAPTSTEISLYCDRVPTSIVRIFSTVIHPQVKLNKKKLSVQKIPLNILTDHEISLINIGQGDASFYITQAEPLEGVRIYPETGIVSRNSTISLYIQIMRKDYGPFECNILISIQGKYVLQCTLQGEVIIPSIVTNPTTVNFRKIAAQSSDRTIFDVENRSCVPAKIDFLLEKFKEFTVTKTLDFEDKIDFLCLKPFETKTLCLHFRPIDVSHTWIYLPIKINDIIDPPSNDNLDILKMHQYSPTLTILGQPLKPLGLKVIGVASREIIHITNRCIELRYFPNENYPTILEEKLVIKNKSKYVESICIRTDTLFKSLQLSHIPGISVETHEFSLSFVLNPEEEIRFLVVFKPDRPGVYKAKLPIYVKKYCDCAVFNYIEIKAEFPEAKLQFLESAFYFEAVPLGTTTKKIVNLWSRYHLSDCYLMFRCEDENIFVDFKDSKR